jgi:NhaP-type Na+/H+ or K+/H+ antiporter
MCTATLSIHQLLLYTASFPYPAAFATDIALCALLPVPAAPAVLQTMSLYKWPALRLAFLPGVCEALFDAGVATAVFGMPFPLALSLGFILKAVGPGLVVPAMFQLQKDGLGANKGIPSTVVIAASFDDIIAITGFSIFVNIAIATGDSAAWQIASGPLQVCGGCATFWHGTDLAERWKLHTCVHLVAC